MVDRIARDPYERPGRPGYADDDVALVPLGCLWVIGCLLGFPCLFVHPVDYEWPLRQQGLPAQVARRSDIEASVEMTSVVDIAEPARDRQRAERMAELIRPYLIGQLPELEHNVAGAQVVAGHRLPIDHPDIHRAP